MSMKNSNRTRDLPACSAVPQPAALPRTPKSKQFKRTYEKCTTCLVASGELKDFAYTYNVQLTASVDECWFTTNRKWCGQKPADTYVSHRPLSSNIFDGWIERMWKMRPASIFSFILLHLQSGIKKTDNINWLIPVHNLRYTWRYLNFIFHIWMPGSEGRGLNPGIPQNVVLLTRSVAKLRHVVWSPWAT
jgi:hypothetical protein